MEEGLLQNKTKEQNKQVVIPTGTLSNLVKTRVKSESG